MTKRLFITHSPEETQALAASLLVHIQRGAVLALHGELGSGKTCFVQGLAKALGVKQTVASPTFTLINEYQGDWPLYHIDLYRLARSDELAGLDLEDYLEPDGITLIEWAERAADLLPPTTMHIYLEAQAEPQSRAVVIESQAPINGPGSTD